MILILKKRFNKLLVIILNKDFYFLNIVLIYFNIPKCRMHCIYHNAVYFIIIETSNIRLEKKYYHCFMLYHKVSKEFNLLITRD